MRRKTHDKYRCRAALGCGLHGQLRPTLNQGTQGSNPALACKTSDKFVHPTLLQFTQLHEE